VSGWFRLKFVAAAAVCRYDRNDLQNKKVFVLFFVLKVQLLCADRMCTR